MVRNLLIAISAIALFNSCGKRMAETRPVRKDVTETVFASGVLEANNTYSLTAQAEGYLERVQFKEGDTVSAGAILATIDNRESLYNERGAAALYGISKENILSEAPLLKQAENSILTSKQKWDEDALEEERYRKLLAANSIAKTDYENAVLSLNNSKANYQIALENYRKLQQDAKQQLISNRTSWAVDNTLLARNQIHAVVGGRIYKKYKSAGDFVKKGDIIAQIGDPWLIYAKVNIDESNISKVRIGQQVLLQLNTDKSKPYKGTVKEIWPAFDDASESFICKIYFKERLDFNITGTQLQANIIIGTKKNALLIPRNFIDFGGKVQIKGQKEKVKLETGFFSNEWVEIISGINDNTVLVTDNIPENNVKTSEAGARFR